MPKGFKTCKSCGESCGPRSFNCPHCGEVFKVKGRIGNVSPNKILNIELNWKELEKGDYIKSIGGHGPFITVFNPELQQDEVVSNGNYGIFKVNFVDNEGIGAYEVSKSRRLGGFAYLYMGEPRLCKKSGSVLRPHKIKKVIRRKK